MLKYDIYINIEPMVEIIFILCLTFLVVMVVFLVLALISIKRLNAFSKAVTSLLQVLPITKVAEAFITYYKSKKTSKAE